MTIHGSAIHLKIAPGHTCHYQRRATAMQVDPKLTGCSPESCPATDERQHDHNDSPTTWLVLSTILKQGTITCKKGPGRETLVIKFRPCGKLLVSKYSFVEGIMWVAETAHPYAARSFRFCAEKKDVNKWLTQVADLRFFLSCAASTRLIAIRTWRGAERWPLSCRQGFHA